MCQESNFRSIILITKMERAIESARKKLKEKHNFEFPIPITIVEGTGASIKPEGMFIGKDNPLELIEGIVIHEAYHILFGIDQVASGSFAEKDRGNIMPYFMEEMWIFNKMKENFPELATPIYICEQIEAHNVKDFKKESGISRKE